MNKFYGRDNLIVAPIELIHKNGNENQRGGRNMSISRNHCQGIACFYNLIGLFDERVNSPQLCYGNKERILPI
jgi:hypothetical protein